MEEPPQAPASHPSHRLANDGLVHLGFTSDAIFINNWYFNKFYDVSMVQPVQHFGKESVAVGGGAGDGAGPNDVTAIGTKAGRAVTDTNSEHESRIPVS